MIREEDVREAIAEMQGQKNPNANTCIKLAAYYTILDHLTERSSYDPMMHSGKAPDVNDSDFARRIRGKDMTEVVALFDELMTTLQVIHPRLYDGVMSRL